MKFDSANLCSYTIPQRAGYNPTLTTIGSFFIKRLHQQRCLYNSYFTCCLILRRQIRFIDPLEVRSDRYYDLGGAKMPLKKIFIFTFAEGTVFDDARLQAYTIHNSEVYIGTKQVHTHIHTRTPMCLHPHAHS